MNGDDGSRRLRYTWLAAFVAMAGIAAAMVFFNSWAEDRVRASLEARGSIERLHRAVIEAERAQRAYILTRDREYLADANEARAKLDGLADTVRDVVARNAIESRAVDDLFALVEERDAQLASAVEILETQGAAAAVEAVRRNEIRRTSARIFDIVSAIDEEENRILVGRERDAGLFRALLMLAIMGVGGVAVLVTAGGLREEQRLAARLDAANRDLERRVGERTRELEIERARIEHLLRDLGHRVGNNLSMVSSFLLLEALKADDERVRAALERAHHRIVGIASAQRRLRIEAGTAHVDAAAYLAAIMEDVREIVVAEGVVLDLACEPVDLRGADAVALGIIANELITNALKHAFPDGVGRISVSLRAREGAVVLEVADDGRGLPSEEVGGLGGLLVRSMVAALGGRAATSTGGTGPRPGTRWTVCFPHRAPDRTPRTASAEPDAMRRAG
ncbi:sensor histidine kinase [Salinarimonas chemoclinalis]|uniref:sensor histidine kinase n=1 Tax=Salinarimonas chemoclinalis TaxID=3241599 RepID=UPI003558BFD8